MATGLSKTEMERIRKAAEKEFPNDPALQRVHIARKIISAKAKREGLSFFDYVKAHQDEVAHVARK
jgi:hypothetical protein